MTRTLGVERKPGMRQVRSGLSARTVPTPTMTASCRPRMAWATRRAGVPVIHWLWPPWVAMRPSRVDASFSVTIGRPSVMRWLNPSSVSSASASSSPVSTSMPAALSCWSALAVDAVVRVGGGDDNSGDACGDQRIGAGRRSAPVAARFQRYVGGGAFCPFTRHLKGDRFGVRAPSGLCVASANHAAVADENAADRWVGPGRAEASPRQDQGGAHVGKVGGDRHDPRMTGMHPM